MLTGVEPTLPLDEFTVHHHTSQIQQSLWPSNTAQYKEKFQSLKFETKKSSSLTICILNLLLHSLIENNVVNSKWEKQQEGESQTGSETEVCCQENRIRQEEIMH